MIRAIDNTIPFKIAANTWTKAILLLLFWLAVFLQSGKIFGEEFENLNKYGELADTPYFFNLELEYRENVRNTKETNYYDVYQKKTQRKGKVNLALNFFFMDGIYREYYSNVDIGQDESTLLSIRDSLSARAEFLKYFYVFAHDRSMESKYRFIDDQVENFADHETAESMFQGLGVVLGDWRFGLAPNSTFSWTYSVEAQSQRIMREDIEFGVQVFEIVKKAVNKEGPYYELGFKKWISSSVKDDRVGKLDNAEGYLVVGIGFSNNSIAFFGEKLAAGNIKSELVSDASSLTRESSDTNSVIGLQIGIGEASALYFERDYNNRKIALDNVSFESNNREQEEKYTVGLFFNGNFSIELNIANNTIEKDYSESVVNSQSYKYKQSDNLIGISVGFSFSG